MFRSFKGTTLAILLLLMVSSIFVAGQTRRPLFDPDGSFWILGQPPHEFSDFSAINLNPKGLRRLPRGGVQLINGTTFRFRTSIVKQDNFTFTTVTLRGISYSFSGRFLKGGVFAEAALDDETPVLEGVLTKFKAGKKVADAKLKFAYFGGT